jgi:hypothetical protein
MVSAEGSGIRIPIYLDDYGRLFGFSRRIHFSLGFQFIG